MKCAGVLAGLAAFVIAGAAQRSPWADRGDLSYLDGVHEAQRPSAAAIAQLETELEQRPADLPIRTRLIAHYFQYGLAASRLRHVLWVVENRPDSRLAGSPMLRMEPGGGPLNTRGDYEQIRAVWLRQIAAYPAQASIAGNAAVFFEAEEPARSNCRAGDLEAGPRKSRTLARSRASGCCLPR